MWTYIVTWIFVINMQTKHIDHVKQEFNDRDKAFSIYYHVLMQSQRKKADDNNYMDSVKIDSVKK